MTAKPSRRVFLRGGIALAAVPHLPPAMLAQTPDVRHELWYDRPAEQWLQALPTGNGFLGGMVYGGTHLERIALSEATAWSGAPATGEVNPGALPHLHQMRQLFFDGRYEEFQQLCSKYLPGHAKNFGTNLPLPELQLAFEDTSAASDYRRALDLDSAVASVRFRSGDAVLTREVLASHPENVLAIRLTSSRPGRISFRMGFGKSILPGSVTATSDTIIFRGHAYERMHSSGHDGVALHIHARVIRDVPRAWQTGSVRGLCARGAFAVDIERRDGKLRSATIRSKHGGSTPVRYADRLTTVHLQPGQSLRLHPDSFHHAAVGAQEREA